MELLIASRAFYYVSPANNVEIYGELKPKSKVLGNSAATLMGGESKLRFLDRPQDGQYVISMPNMFVIQAGRSLQMRLTSNRYARGILFGKVHCLSSRMGRSLNA